MTSKTRQKLRKSKPRDPPEKEKEDTPHRTDSRTY